MISHHEIGPEGFAASRKLKTMIHTGQITLAGNRNLKIYGLLSCGSGKRMKRRNRVFFADEHDARTHGYRPCGHCMREAYLKWKSG
ncbi:Ada metal-binding domain-containing protein [Dyadobacter jiangsuensis]|uniref:Metal binding Ada-like protein n=1 Tax=Dyadobacter jiangsuensis TaxID=1591085 RepID=A0A2P8FR27_9BACT|nr:Ada metal-binding domain-containing protein [Dyadobacter jiangsuensis]PSL24181.1 metal binding Ada-like protein [Dyadobacter jiangsuensis]